MIPKFIPHVLTSLLSPASPIGYLNLAQTHRPKAGTSPAPRKTCASSRECPLPCESGSSHSRLHRLVSIFNKWPRSDYFNLGSVYFSPPCEVGSGLSHLSASSSPASLPGFLSPHSSQDDLSKHRSILSLFSLKVSVGAALLPGNTRS